MSEHDVVRASTSPITEESLTSDLSRAGVRDGMVLLVHSSLSALGWVCGGPLTVVRALTQSVGAAGTLVFPTHSADLSDPANWENPPVPPPWWETIRTTMPAFDPALTPTRGMGAIAELFRSFPGVRRSNHPAASFAALGPHAETVIAEHQLDDPFGERSPLARLYEVDASVLLLGVGFACCTTLHLAERRALGANQPRVPGGAPILVDGIRRWIPYQQPDVDSEDFGLAGVDYERHSGAVTVFTVGNTEAKLFGVKPLVDFGVRWFRRHRV